MIVFYAGKNGQFPNIATFIDSTSESTYTHFSVPIPPTAGDSGIIGIWISNSNWVSNEQGISRPNLHLGTEFKLDDLVFTGGDAVLSTNNASFGLEQNYPNPFNSSTTIRYSLSEEDHVTLEIVNMIGERVALLQDGNESQGRHEVFFDGEHFRSGPYLCRLITASQGISSQILQLSH